MQRIIGFSVLSLTLIAPLQAATVGTRATFSQDSHNVSGTATVLDFDRLRIDDFTFDGGGISVYFYLGAVEDHASFIGGLETGPELVGTVFDGTQAPIFIDLPAGQTMADYDAISVWCVVAQVSFGSGTFEQVPEPSVTLLGALSLAACAARRRR